MSQRRIRERGGTLIREKAHLRGRIYLKGKLLREGGFVKETAHKRRSIIREGLH